MIATTPIDPARFAAIQASVVSVLAGIKGQPSVPGGYDVLRYFLQGWLVHVDPVVQKDLELFAFAHAFDGALVPEASAKGYAVLRAAVAGLLQPHLTLAQGRS